MRRRSLLYATVDRQLEFIGGGRRPVEADDWSGPEQDDQYQRKDDPRRRFTGQFIKL